MSDSDKVGSSTTGDEQLTQYSSRLNNNEKKADYVNADTFDDEKSSNVEPEYVEVKRSLNARMISMIAIGGTIGTGLFISTGGTLADAALGAANGWNYWFSWAITFALELSVVGQVIQLWTDAVPLAAWITIFFVILTVFNLFPVKYYGEVEFWIAFLKVIAVVGWLLYAFIIVCGAGKTGPVGFRYWRNPGPWGPGILVENVNTGRFLGWLASLINAAFTFQGTELVGISAGESANPRKTVPSAIRKVLFRILVFYVLCMLFIGLLVPYDDPKLAANGYYTASSPFIVAMQNAGTKILPDIFNAVVLVTIISAGNSNIYCGSRILYGLAEAGVAPKFFKRTTKHGVPYVAVLFTASFGSLGYLACSDQGNNAFNWLLNITATSGLIAWGWISFTHIRFMQILKQRGIERDSLPFKAKFMPYGAYYAAIAIFILVFVQGFQAFFGFTATAFFTAYVSIILFVVCWIVFHFYFNGFGAKAWKWSSVFIPIEECDIDSGVREIDDLVWEEEPPKNIWEKFWNWVA
ncbi:arginine permease [Scheffersomyces coipomensis]|uniref:arginine permease n=1 Tax=Scheffersomyces coipomensis TaxID=1788519 RepID=UPI00315CCEC2